MNAKEPYPRILNGDGCFFGRALKERIEGIEKRHGDRMKEVEKKLDRLTWAAVMLTVALMTASLTMWISYIGP